MSDKLNGYGPVSSGQPGYDHKAKFNPPVDLVDICSVLASLLALILAIVAISPSLPYAAQLQYTKQIIIIGFLLGIMNQALQRVLVFFCLLLERRLGSSSLQNYDGLLRWSPLAARMNPVWRVSVTMSLILPLALSVLYKRFTGGVGFQIMPELSGDFAPTVLPGLQKVAGLSMMANATIPFLADSAEESGPPDFRNNATKPYGYNILLISNTSAAALDIPARDVLSRLQDGLRGDEVYYLGTRTRGTVATYNATVESHRDDAAFWNKYTNKTALQLGANYDGYWFGMLNRGSVGSNDSVEWDASWVFLGDFGILTINQSDSAAALKGFQQTALGFDVKRHDCYATFKITRSFVGLEDGQCSASPLPWQYQYYQDAQLAMGQFFFPMIQQTLGNPFDNITDNSVRARWRVPTYAVAVASMYQTRVTMANSVIPIQPGGPIYNYWKKLGHINGDNQLVETYPVANGTLRKTGPTLRADPSLYFILAVQPMLTMIAFCVPFILIFISRFRRADSSGCPILPRGFGLLSILAGLDQESFAVLRSEGHKAFTSDAALTGDTNLRITLDLVVDPYYSATTDEYDKREGNHHGLGSYRRDYRKPNNPSLRYVLTGSRHSENVPQ